jgi:hypothetical protein
MSIHPLTEDEIKDFKQQLSHLRLEHRDLDQVINIMTAQGTFDQLQIRRLKIRKLKLRDHINMVENLLIPDLDA